MLNVLVILNLAVYYVTERCQDGWYKGTNRSQRSGVFPGNYVAPLRHSRDGGSGHTATSSKRSASGHSNGAGSSSSSSQRQSHRSRTANSSHHIEATSSLNPPPELPPRSGGSSMAVASNSVWSKPLGHHVEALFGRKSSSNQASKLTNARDAATAQNGAGSSKREQSSPSTAASTTVSLIKRFTNMKRSKSPVNAPTYSMDNPVFEDIPATTPSNGTNGTTVMSVASKRNTIHLSHPVHVRSGSCPSQLLQSLPIDVNLSSHAIKKTGDASLNSAYMFGSQRVKGHKERPTLHRFV